MYRGLLNKKWMRMEPLFLRLLYSGISQFDWTMVGQITYLPLEEKEAKPTDDELRPTEDETHVGVSDMDSLTKENEDEGQTSTELNSSVESNNPDPTPSDASLRDSFTKMFGALDELSRIFFESKSRLEFVVSPLAIYRETSVKLEIPEE